MITTIVLLLIVLPLLIFHVCTRYCRKGRLCNKMPGPTPYPLLGNMPIFMTGDMHRLWETMRSLTKKYYPILRLWGFHTAFVHVYHPDDLEVILSSQKVLEKGFVYWFLQPWLNRGLLTSTDEKWKHRRKILTPAFHFGILKKYVDIMSEHAKRITEALKDEGDECVKNLNAFCSNYTLNVICETTMGASLSQMNTEEVSKYKEAINDMGVVIMYRLVRPYMPDRLLNLVSEMGRMQTNALKTLHEFTDKIIQERKKYHLSTGNKYLNEYDENLDENVYDDSDVGCKKRLAMLDLMLGAEKNGLMDRKGIHEEVDTFTFEGHDTSSMAMLFALMLLAENKEVQERARAEVTRVVDNSNGKIGMSEMKEFNYLEKCIKESLRLYPSVATIMRVTHEDLQLKHGLVPASTHLMLHFWDTHRDPNFWPDPHTFDPDRFLPEQSKNRHPFSYLPFSAGPRNCIGQKFAMMELKLVIGRILYDFYIEPVDRLADVKIKADIILRPRDPVHVRFIRIKK